MKKIWLAISISSLSLIFWNGAFAQESGTQEAASTEKSWKEELSAGRQELKGQAQELKEHAQAAKQEMKDLKEQIHSALQSGDMETAKRLRDELKARHQEHLQQRKEDFQALHKARQEFKEDVKAARKEWRLRPRKEIMNPPAASEAGPLKEHLRDLREDKRDRREDLRDRPRHPDHPAAGRSERRDSGQKAPARAPRSAGGRH